MAIKKTSKGSKVKVGKLQVKTSKVKANDLKKVKGGATRTGGGWDIGQNVKA